MKKRTLKKLALHRETLHSLQETALGQVAGGLLSLNTCGSPCTKTCTTPCSDTCHTQCGGAGCPL